MSAEIQLSAQTNSSLPENVAALLSYVLGWITGLVFLLIDKRPYVRFHAAQSVVVFLHLLRGVLGMIFGMGWWFGGVGYWGAFTVGVLLMNLVSLLSLVPWIVLMVKAFQGVRFKLPVTGEIAESLASNRQ
jgi:uncharacterized membrane protein